MPSVHSWLNALSFISCAAALPSKRLTSNTVHLDVVSIPPEVQGDLTPNQNAQFFVKYTLGGQTIYSLLDTGSSNLVVFPEAQNQHTCSSGSTDICDHITYDPTKSTTSKNLKIAYSPGYTDGSGGSGSLYTDTLGIDGRSIEDFEFAYITNGNTVSNGVFGVGYRNSEGVNPASAQYDNLPYRLTNQNAISAPVYSVWLNSERSPTPGSLLFGGVDTAKYCGTLQKLPIVPEIINDASVYNEFNVQVYAITATDPKTNKQTKVDTLASSADSYVAILDTGNNGLAIPSDVYNSLLKLYSATAPTNANGYPSIDCKYGNSDYTLDVTFNNNFVLPVPLSQLIDPVNNGDTCTFRIGIRPAGQAYQPINFGAPLISAAYLVFDLSNNDIYMARAIFDASSSVIVPVTNVDGIVTVPNPNGLPCSSQSTTTTTTTTTTMASTTTTKTVSTTASSKTTTSFTMTTTSQSSATTSPAPSVSTSSSMTTSSGKTTSTGMTTTSGTTASSSTWSSSTGTISSTSGGFSSTTSTWTWSSTSSWSGNPTLSTTTTASGAWPSSVSGQWGTWANNPYTTSSTTASAWTSSPSGAWATWSSNPWTTSTSASITPAATWSSWNAQYTQSLSYSTVTTTIYVCPASLPNCAASQKTQTVTQTVVPYTTSTIYTTKAITVTAACPAGVDCSGGYYTTSWTVVPVTTTVFIYTSAAATATASWSGVSSGTGAQASAASWSPMSPSPSSQTSVASWSAVTSSSAPQASAASWSGVSTPAASAWAAAGAPNGNGPIATYKGSASASHEAGYVMMLTVGLIGFAITLFA